MESLGAVCSNREDCARCRQGAVLSIGWTVAVQRVKCATGAGRFHEQRDLMRGAGAPEVVNG